MKRCFVLGAGASIGHTNGLFPSTNTFFSKLTDATLLQKIPELSHQGFDNLDTYISNRFGYSIAIDRVDIEKILTGLEIDIERNPDDPEYAMIRLELIEFVVWLLVKMQEAVNDEKGEYNLLCELLNKADTIVTFNWDCLLDYALERLDIIAGTKSGVQEDQYSHFYETLTGPAKYLNFLQQFPLPIDRPKYKNSNPKSNKQSGNKDIGYYLKMHGSVDWLYCKNNSCREYQHIFPVEKPLDLKNCGYCREELSRLIIPPILNKGIREHPTIRRIWNIAREELMNVEEVVIWGYSLPPTDFYSYWLLRQARTDKFKKVVLINCALSPSYNGSKELKDRLLEPFKGKIDVNAPDQVQSFLSFSDYYDAVSASNDS